MLDFVKVRELSKSRTSSVDIYPEFLVKPSKDLMIRGKQFYAVWDEERGLWSKDESDVQRLIDDMIYIMRKEYFRRAKEAGYQKYTELAQHFQQIISTCENLREDLNIFFILHSEDIMSDNSITGYKVSTIGKLLDSQYNPVEVVPMVLYSDIQYDDKGNATYGFYTHRTMKGTVEIPAKSPDGLFEEGFIPNDLALVIKAMNEYYG